MKYYRFLNKDFMKDIIISKDYAFYDVDINTLSSSGAYYCNKTYDVNVEGYVPISFTIRSWGYATGEFNLYYDRQSSDKLNFFADAKTTVGIVEIRVFYLKNI